MIKSYRGKLADGDKNTISLHTNDGKTGYTIKKISLINSNPGDVDYSAVVKVYSIPQTTVDNNIDFEDSTLLAAGYISTDASSTQFPEDLAIVFDNVTINQDIFVTCKQTGASDVDSCNYYIELEQVSLTEDQALVAIVKNLRNEQ